MEAVPDTVKLYGKVKIGDKVIVGEYTIIGYGVKSPPHEEAVTIIGDECIIGSHIVIYKGAKIGGKTKIDDFCRIGEGIHLGQNCYVLYGAKIYDDVSIGENSIIGGFICERAKIGENVKIFGELLHSHKEPHLGWDDVIEESPIIEDCVFIGFGAKIIGGIRIGRNSYIAAGAIVTKNVPSKSIVSCINNILPYNNWKGKLKKSQFFGGC
jgi:acetyltransferase-like isoleucine patch superfamily enzyme